MMESPNSRLDYSHRDVTTLPDDVIAAHTSVSTLDVSNNRISDITFTECFTNLNSLILDHNLITEDAQFPFMPKLTTLWLNFNDIKDVRFPFIPRLNESCPNLKHLSMMGNKASPPCTEDTFYDYVQYRLFIISLMRNLEYLDDRAVTQDEREEAQRLYGKAEEPAPFVAASSFLGSLMDKFFNFIDPTPVTGRSHPSSANVI